MLNNVSLKINQTGGGAMVTIMVIFNIIFMLAIIGICVIIFVPSVNSFFLSKDNSLSVMFPTIFDDSDDSDDIDDNDIMEEEIVVTPTPSITSTPSVTPNDS